MEELNLIQDFCRNFSYYKYTKLKEETKKLFIEVASELPSNERTKQVLIYDSTFRDVITKVSRIPCVIASEMKLLPQQLLIVLQMMRQRSIIVVHSTGSGKTLTAVTVAECLLRNDMIDRIVVV